MTDRIVNTFLVSLDGISALKKTFVVGATSRPDIIDPALLRPGRIDRHIFCDLPSYDERADYIKSYFSNKKLSIEDHF